MTDADMTRFVRLVREYQVAARNVVCNPMAFEMIVFEEADKMLTAALRQLTQRQEPQLFADEEK